MAPPQTHFLTQPNVSTAAQQVSAKSTCRFFPDCKNLDCSFYHPKVGTQRRRGVFLCRAVLWKQIEVRFSALILFTLCVQQPCRFAAQCKRAGCTFYHPAKSVPPRHALKWTKAQSRWPDGRQMCWNVSYEEKNVLNDPPFFHFLQLIKSRSLTTWKMFCLYGFTYFIFFFCLDLFLRTKRKGGLYCNMI